MLWLFGQIWLWLLVAFALGAATSWLALRYLDRPKTEKRPPEPEDPERTQYIPAPIFTPSEPLDRPYADQHYEEEDHYFEDDGQEPDGHREGSLPLPPPRSESREDWPAEEEPVWPMAEDTDATRRWPGRSG